MNPLRRVRASAVAGIRRATGVLVERRPPGRWVGTSFVGNDVFGIENVAMAGHNRIGRNATFAREVALGLGSTVGVANYIVGPVEIGNYTQLGPGVYLYGQDHPLETLTPYTARPLFDGALRDNMHLDRVSLGHSVWVGCNAMVLSGATVGNGAVVGAGSVVKGEIPPYAVAVGNPARVVRYRFDAETIDRIERTRWWTMTPGELEEFEKVFHADLTVRPEAVDELGVGRGPGLTGDA